MYRTLRLVILLFALLLCLPACRTQPETVSTSRFDFQRGAMGTLFRISLYAPDQATAREAADAAFDRVDELEEILSDYQADSELSQLRERTTGVPIPVSEDLYYVLERSMEIYDQTGGAFDVTAGPFTRLWRFSRKRGILPALEELEEARRSVGMDKLRLDRKNRTVTLLAPGMRLDVGGIAKGYAADEALAVLTRAGFPRALVAASGDIVAGEAPPGKSGWSVAVEGIDRAGLSEKFLLRKSAVSTSGDTEQYVEIGNARYSHILDPGTGLGLTNRIQATVLAPNAAATDALATSVCILGPARGLRLIESVKGAAVLVIEKKDGWTTILRSRNLQRFQEE